LEFYTDASNRAFGAYFLGAWLFGTFKDHGFPARRSIAFKELIAIIAALTAWAPLLTGKRILFHGNNEAVVHILQKGRSVWPHSMTLACYSFFLCTHYSIEISAVHIPGAQNNRADALSRLQIRRFRSLTPDADSHPTPVLEISLTPFR